MERWLKNSKTVDDLLTGADGEEDLRWLKKIMPTAKAWMFIVNDGEVTHYKNYCEDPIAIYMLKQVKTDIMTGEE